MVNKFHSYFCILIFCFYSIESYSREVDQGHINWSIEKVKAIANNIRASESLKPEVWKHDKRVAVMISIDVDNELAVFATSASKNHILEGAMSFAEYGANEGLPRIIQVLKREDVPATFFIPALMLEIHPETVAEIQRLKNYEVGVHGWIHELNSALPDFDTEKNLIEKSIDLLKSKFDKTPVGYRAPSWDFSPHTIDVVKDLGFVYDSSLMARDDPYEICERQASGVSESTGILELPVSWILDDYPLLSMSTGSYSSPRAVLQVYKDEFDQAYKEGGLFNLALHPHVIGRRSRILILEELISYMKSKKGVWFATHREVAEYVRKKRQGQESKCP